MPADTVAEQVYGQGGDTLQRERGGVRDVAADTVVEQVYGQVGRHPAEGERGGGGGRDVPADTVAEQVYGQGGDTLQRERGGSERCGCRYCGRAGVWTGGETPCRGREGE